ncbi:tripeptidase T [Selenomonas sp. TAMA-11512]|nr:tripeptidase T [Selenomonas sp. TAMA-11512]
MADEMIRLFAELDIFLDEDNAGSRIGGTAGNLFGRIEGTGSLATSPPILLSGHLDSVNPAIGKKAILRDGTITSDETTVLGADDLAALTAIYEAIRYIKEQQLPHRPLELLFSTAEELYDLGIEQFDFSKLESKEAYIIDANGEIGSFIYQAPSIISFSFTIHGKAAHAGFAPEDGIHAIQIVAHAASKSRLGRITKDTTVNIGEIIGGTGANIIPASCTVKGEIRSYEHKEALSAFSRLETHFKTIAESAGATLESTRRIALTAYSTPLDTPVVARLQAAATDVGLSFIPKASFGGSDANQLAAHGIAGVVLSCGFQNAHSTKECITVDDLYKTTQLLIALITR